MLRIFGAALIFIQFDFRYLTLIRYTYIIVAPGRRYDFRKIMDKIGVMNPFSNFVRKLMFGVRSDSLCLEEWVRCANS